MSVSNQVTGKKAYRKFRKNLLGGTALVAVVAVGISFGAGQFYPAMAAGDGANGNTELDGATAITADNTDGLLESNATGTQTDTININGTTDLILGAEGSGGADALTMVGSASALTLTVNVSDSTAGTDTFTIAGDIELANTQADILNLNIITAGLNTTLTGDVTAATGATVNIKLGDGATGSNTLTINTVSNQNLAIAANIDSAVAGNTTNLAFANDGGGANTVTISGAVGATVALDDVSVDAAANDPLAVTFSSSVATTTLSVVSNATGNETAAATIVGNLTASGAVTVTGTDNAAASLTLQGGTISATSFTLDTDTGVATLTIDADNGAQTIAGTILGASSGEGALVITDSDAADVVADTQTFAGAIGGTTLNTIQVGNGSTGAGAIFASTVATAGTITIDAGNGANETAAVEFQGNVTNGGALTLDENGGGAAVVTFNTTNGAIAVSGAVTTANAGEGDLVVIDDDGGAPDAVTFANTIGAANVGTLTVGSATLGGSAIFSLAGTVATINTVTVIGGDAADEDSVVEFRDGLTASGGLTLNDNTGSATLLVNATEGTQTIGSAITAATAGEGTIAIIDDDAGATPDVVTLSGVVGANQIGALTVGNATQGGSAVFTSANAVVVGAVTVTGGDNGSEDSLLEIQDALTATTVTLNDGTGDATIEFNATNDAQTIAGTIDGAAAGEGTLNITDDDDGAAASVITFSGVIGGTAGLKALNVGGNATAGEAGSAVFSSAVTAAAINVEAGTAANENSAATFNGAVNATTLTLTADATQNTTATATVVGNLTATGAVTLTGANDAVATLELQGTTNSAGSFVLDTDTGIATLTLNATDGVMSVAGTIDGAAGGEGVLLVTDDDSAAAGDLVTFTGAIGVTQQLADVQIGGAGATQAGNALFEAAVDSVLITLDGGGASENATAEFQNSITATTIVLDDATGEATLTVNATNGAQTVAGTIDGGSSGDGTLAVIDDDADAAPDALTFSGRIGATQPVGDLTVGNATQGGSAVFTNANPVVINRITITGGDNAAEDSIVELQDALTATSTTLNDGTGTATININTANGAQTIAGTILGAAAGEGTLGVFDGDAGNSDLATFSGAIGGTSLSAINIGTATQGGDANFGSTSAATTVTITGGDAASENAGLVAVGASTFTTLTMTGGGNASADATAEFQATGATLSTTSITLDDATGQAELTFNATNGAQAVTGTIDGAAAGEGKLIITDDDAGEAAQAATFAGNVGATNSLLAIEVGTVAGAALAGSAVFSGTTAATTVTLTAGNAALETALATFTGDLTATTLALVGGGNSTADTIATITGNATTAITLDDVTGQSTLIFNGGAAAGQTISGTITSITAGDGDISVTNTTGPVTFSSALGVAGANELNGITLAANSTTIFDSTVDADTLSASGAATFRGAVILDETFTTGANSTITLGSAFVAGTTVITSVGSEGTLNQTADTVTLNMDPTFSTGTLTLVNDTNALDATDAASFNVNDTALVNYTVAAGNSNVEVTAVKNSVAVIAGTLNVSQSAATSLDAGVTAAAGDATVSQAYSTALNAGGAEAKKAAEQSEPAQAAAASSAVGSGATATGNIVSSRLASVRGESNTAYASARGQTGFSAGGGAMSKSAWFRPFVSGADQDANTDIDGGPIDGYNSSTTGVAGGFDGMIGEQTRLGLSFSYGDTEIDGDGIQNDKTEIDNYQFTLYGDYTADNFYLEGMFSYGLSHIDTSREINFGGLNLLARGDYDANQYSWRFGGGLPIARGRTTFTPSANFQFTSVTSDAFTETGAGVLNLTVAPEDLDMAVATLGVNWQSSFQSEGGTWTPQIRTSVSYDFAGDEADSVSSFTGQNTTFTTKGAQVEELGGAIGGGVTLSHAGGKWDVSADYDADLKNDFVGHTGRLQAKINF